MDDRCFHGDQFLFYPGVKKSIMKHLSHHTLYWLLAPHPPTLNAIKSFSRTVWFTDTVPYRKKYLDTFKKKSNKLILFPCSNFCNRKNHKFLSKVRQDFFCKITRLFDICIVSASHFKSQHFINLQNDHYFRIRLVV